MANTEGMAPRSDSNLDLISQRGRDLLGRQERLQAQKIQAINAGDENRRRLIDQELDEIRAELEK